MNRGRQGLKQGLGQPERRPYKEPESEAYQQMKLQPERSGPLNRGRLEEKPLHDPEKKEFRRIAHLIAAGNLTMPEVSLNAAAGVAPCL